MRTARHLVLTVLAGMILLVMSRFIVLTKQEEMFWFVIDRRAVLTVDGRPADGFVHLERKHPFVIVTRNRPSIRESFLIMLSSDPKNAYIDGCDQWTAPRLPVFPFPVFTSDGLPCLGWRSDFHSERHRLTNPKLVVGPTSLGFATNDGALIQVRWK
jgi:hypothetical protein